MTIGDRFRLAGCALEEMVEDISAGEFDPRCLQNYEHRLDLQECCRLAVAELSEEPFLGRVSHAKAMGLAMERLRDSHEADVPRGWYPVMKILRSGSGSAAGGSSSPLLGSSPERTARQSPASPAPHEEEVVVEEEVDLKPDSIWLKQRAAPCDVLTDMRSAFRFFDTFVEPEDSLLALCEEIPPFLAVLVLSDAIDRNIA